MLIVWLVGMSFMFGVAKVENMPFSFANLLNIIFCWPYMCGERAANHLKYKE